MSEEIIFRKVRKTEIEQYHCIRLDCLKNYPDNFGTLYEEEKHLSDFSFDAIINKDSATEFLMGAFEDERLIGICGFTREKRKKTNHIGKISGFYVLKEFSGQHIGSGLLQATINEAFSIPALEQIVLSVAESNKIAQKLYINNGFVAYGKLENYFKYNDIYETQIFMCLKRK